MVSVSVSYGLSVLRLSLWKFFPSDMSIVSSSAWLALAQSDMRKIRQEELENFPSLV